MKKITLKYFKELALCFSLFVFVACAGCTDKGTGQTWEFSDENETDAKEKPRFIWVDAAANFPDFANSKDNIRRDLTKAKEAGFTDIVVDVRPTMGDALFKTNNVDQVQWLAAWVGGSHIRVQRTETWDYLGAFIEIGHELGLKIHAALNTFVGAGNMNLSDGSHQVGLLYRDPSKKDWATSLLVKDNTSSGTIVNTLDQNTVTGSKFFNPVHEDVQEFLCKLIEDVASYPDLDGIFLDRGRFENLSSDFSPYTQKKFEEFLGAKVTNFPADVMEPGTTPATMPTDPPVHFKKWLEFRAKVIHDFMAKAQQRVKAKNPKLNFGVYVGGWYSTYYEVGVNWASPKFDTASSFPKWATKDYQKYGYANLMDVMLIGAYAGPTKIEGNNEWTVQGFCVKAKEKIKGDATVVGGPDVGNGAWATSSDEVVGDAIIRSVDAVMDAADGYFLFDMIHLKKKDQWHYAEEGIDRYLDKISK